MLLHVSHEWGVRPAEVLSWSMDEFNYACAYLKLMADQQRRPTEES